MEYLDKFQNEMNLSGHNVFVGNRYVPKLDGEWDNSKPYESLTIVQYQGNSFTSRQPVPSGIDISNRDYWVSTGNYNAQIEYYRRDVVKVKDDLIELSKHVDDELLRVETELDEKIDDGLAEVNQKVDDGLTEVNQKVDEGLQNITDIVDEKLEGLENYIVSITQFGAVYDDPTFDNMPIIALAQDYIVNNSPNKKGKIYFPALGTLYVKPFLKLQSGIELVGHISRPVIKVCPDVKDFYMLFGIEHTEHNAITNLTIDSNFENRTGYDISENPQILIQLSNAEYVDVSNNTLIGHGVWVFAVFTGASSDYSRYIKFNHNHVIWKGGLSSDKMGPAYGVDVDNTTVYWDAMDYEMRDNIIETDDGLKNMTCIEMHGANAILDNNTVKGFRTGLIVWSLVANTAKSADVKSNNLYVTNNKFLNVEAGITCGTTSNETYGSFDLENVHLLNNNVLLAPTKFDRASGRGLEINIKTNGRNIKVKNNIVESLPNTRKFADPATIYNFTGLSINGGNLSGVEVVGNTFKNINGVGILVSSGAESPVILADSIIKDNLIIDAGRGGNIDFDGFQHRTAITIVRNARNTLVRTKIGVNHIRDTKETGSYFTRPVNGLIAIDDDQDIISSKGQWSGKVSVPVKIQIDGDENEYIRPTTDNRREVYFEKDEVRISHTIWIDKTYTGDNVYMHLPIPANISQWSYYNGSYGYYDSATGETVNGTMFIDLSRKNIAWFGMPYIKGRRLKQNDYIWFEFKYPVDIMDKYRL